MSDTVVEKKSWSLVGKDPYKIPLEEIDLSHPGIWQANEYLPFLERLRKEAPVHFCPQSAVGAYWSVTTYDLIKQVDLAPDIFSSEPTIGIVDMLPEFQLPMFIAMDPPKHTDQRRAVQGILNNENLKVLEKLVRQRVCNILDSLPVGTPFDWVDTVSIELTSQMLATLFDFPFEERHKLPFWSDVATAIPTPGGVIESYEQRGTILMDCLNYFLNLREQRADNVDGFDFISRIARGDATKHMEPQEFLGNILLLIVGGNDTTRNSISGGVLALNQNPAEYEKLRNNPDLIASMVPEIIRWQTPLAYMRRTAMADTELGGQQLRKGDKVIMWYASGNLDENAIPNANQFIIDRENARQHLAFGSGIHRCMGSRLAELQLRILWEEILPRFRFIEVVGEPERTYSSFVKGFTHLPVVLHAH